jgi:hypothetical protein
VQHSETVRGGCRRKPFARNYFYGTFDQHFSDFISAENNAFASAAAGTATAGESYAVNV